jgi:hypothetical protein
VNKFNEEKFQVPLKEFMECDVYKRDSFHWSDMARVFFKKGMRSAEKGMNNGVVH